jgi:MFS transporter, DHA2 family, methylenomycin A resistance protein
VAVWLQRPTTAPRRTASVPTLIAARALQGVGAAVLGPCSLTLINHADPKARERVRALGVWAAGASVGLSVGPLVGGILTATLGWRAIFFINAPIGAAGICLTMRWAARVTPRSSANCSPAASASACSCPR